MTPHLCEFLSRPPSNEPPSEEELPHIRSMRQECVAGISAIDRQIEELIAQRMCLENDLGRYDSLLSPIKRVPVEVLLKIFHHATVNPSDELKLLTVVTSTVCRAWRQLAVDTPTLWNTIDMRVPNHPRLGYTRSSAPGLLEEKERMWDRRVARVLANARLWLDRSRQCPISLLLQFDTIAESRQDIGWDRQDLGVYRSLVDLACSVAHRWREVDMDIMTRDQAIVQPILCIEPQHVPQLESLCFQTVAQRHGGHSSFYPSGLLGCPSMRSVFVLYINRPWNQLPINWRGLKKLQFAVKLQEFDAISVSEVEKVFTPFEALSLLQTCSNLEECQLAVHGYEPDRGAVKRARMLRMAHLRSFKFHKSEAVEGLMAMLDLPSLEQLHFVASRIKRKDKNARAFTALAFVRTIGHFGAQLADIRFNLLLLEDTATVTSCFSNLPHLLKLQLDSDVPDAQVFGQAAQDNVESSAKLLLSLLTPAMEGGLAVWTPICPKLRRFVCTLRIKGFTESQLSAFIISRSRGDAYSGLARIEEVVVTFGIVKGMDIQDTLEKEGIDMDRIALRLHYPLKPYLSSYL